MSYFISLPRYYFLPPFEITLAPYQTDSICFEAATHTIASTRLTPPHTISADNIPRKVRPPVRGAALLHPCEVIDHCTGRDVDEMTLGQLSMTVPHYTALDGRGHKTFVEDMSWGDMRYECLASQIMERHGFQQLSRSALASSLISTERPGTAIFQSVGLVDMPLICCQEEANYHPRVNSMVESVHASPLLPDVDPDLDLLCLDRPFS